MAECMRPHHHQSRKCAAPISDVTVLLPLESPGPFHVKRSIRLCPSAQLALAESRTGERICQHREKDDKKRRGPVHSTCREAAGAAAVVGEVVVAEEGQVRSCPGIMERNRMAGPATSFLYALSPLVFVLLTSGTSGRATVTNANDVHDSRTRSRCPVT